MNQRKLPAQRVTIDLGGFFAGTVTAKLADLPEYRQRTMMMIPDGTEVILTGQAPVWLYLYLAHALHGRACRLFYDSPVTGLVEIFNHDPH